MRRKYEGRPVLRTPVVVAGNNEKYIRKAFASDCDCIVMDTEDGVPPNFKKKARKMIHDTLNSDLVDGRPVFVRINSLETGETKADIDGVACENLDGFVYTKPYSEGDIQILDVMLSKKEEELGVDDGYFKVIVIIETPSSVLNVHKIAFSSKRLVGLLFGAEDLLGDMEGFHGPDGRTLHMARSQVLLACRAAGLIPIDTPFIKVHDDKALEEFIVPALELGYEGMLLISPSQIETAKRMYTPDISKVKDAYKMSEIAKGTDIEGRGVSVHNKLFISPPTLKRAVNIIKRYENILEFEKHIENTK